MFQWFRQLSVTTRLRTLAFLAVVAMLALSSSLLWTGYQQRLADRQAVASQHMDPARARLHRQLNAGATDDVHSAMLSQAAFTLTAVLMISALLWGCIEVTARDLRGVGGAAPDTPSHAAAAQVASGERPSVVRAKPAARGPLAYRQGLPASQAAVPRSAPSATLAMAEGEEGGDANEAAIQEVKRLRMAGAI